jgi:acetyl esterase/lipase
MSILLLAASIALLAMLASAEPAPAMPDVPTESARLWDGPAPEAKGDGADDVPALAICRAERPNGAAVIVCPGGGYNILMQDHEGRQVARWFNRRGVAAFVLSYRLKSKGYDPGVARLDASRAVRWVRSRAAELGLSADRIGIVGFSAGAHLALQAALHADAGDPKAADRVERASSRPDRVLAIYGPPEMRDAQAGDWRDRPRDVLAGLPPVFFMLAADDASWASKPAFELCQALAEAGVDAEYHLFGGYGPHGVGLATGHPAMREWPELAFRWMRQGGFFTDRPRAAVSGTITIDGAPLRWGWVTLDPVDDPHRPAATAMCSSKDGAYAIPAKHGPVPGRYRVTIDQSAAQVLRDRPSLDDARRFTRRAPGDAEEMTCEIREGENRLDVAVVTR